MEFLVDWVNKWKEEPRHFRCEIYSIQSCKVSWITDAQLSKERTRWTRRIRRASFVRKKRAHCVHTSHSTCCLGGYCSFLSPRRGDTQDVTWHKRRVYHLSTKDPLFVRSISDCFSFHAVKIHRLPPTTMSILAAEIVPPANSIAIITSCFYRIVDDDDKLFLFI